MTRLITKRLFAATLLALPVTACTVGPDYARPAMKTSTGYKTAPGWVAATPADHLDRAGWWKLFGDPKLNELAEQATRANQTIALADANYRQARAFVREQRSSLFPTVDLSGSATRSGSLGGGTVTTIGGGTGTGTTISSGTSGNSSYRVNIGASWEPDLFGRIRRTVENARATADARLADLYSAQLAVQGELVTNYLALRATDAQIELSRRTTAGYQRSLQIATNRYNAGVVARTDVFQAQSLLATTQSDLEGLNNDRRVYENAIAVLVGVPAGDFRISPAPRVTTVPRVPVDLPSTLLQRRPDIAALERAVAAANATIGIEKSAFFPSLVLTGDGGVSASSIGNLFSSAATLWSVGASLAQTIFDAGARSARVEQARAAYDAAVAQYRQTTLTAFADVENQLTASAVLSRQQAFLQTASEAADRSETTILNQYLSGQINYTDVVTAQATALNARRSLLQSSLDRQTVAVALIQAIGGGWDDSLLRGAAVAAP
jgi:NodT family efflux transporter outer membrane factor (OMF) lipoprotein